jgi:hypothetical protein
VYVLNHLFVAFTLSVLPANTCFAAAASVREQRFHWVMEMQSDLAADDNSSSLH